MLKDVAMMIATSMSGQGALTNGENSVDTEGDNKSVSDTVTRLGLKGT